MKSAAIQLSIDLQAVKAHCSVINMFTQIFNIDKNKKNTTDVTATCSMSQKATQSEFKTFVLKGMFSALQFVFASSL